MLLKEKVTKAIQFLTPLVPTIPKVAIVLGSGLGGAAELVNAHAAIPSHDIPHHPKSSVPGHAGEWLFGEIKGVPVLVVKGRVHYYEGYSLEQVTLPIHIMANLGINNLFLTTASGGLDPTFKPGDFMLMTDQINFGFANPLIGRPENLIGPRFPDMSKPYDIELINIAEKALIELEINYHKGVFCWVTGPNYETAAEVRMLQKIGASAVSMSTGPEVIVARQRQLSVLGLSVITNLAAGLTDEKLTHDDVLEISQKSSGKLGALLERVILNL